MPPHTRRYSMLKPTPVTRSRLPCVAIAVWALILAADRRAGARVRGPRGRDGRGQRPAGAAAAARSAAPLAADPSRRRLGRSRRIAAAPANPARPATARAPEGAESASPSAAAAAVPVRRRLPAVAVRRGSRRRSASPPSTATSCRSRPTTAGRARSTQRARRSRAAAQTITVADLKVGDQIRLPPDPEHRRHLQGHRRSSVVPPRAAGTVKTVDGSHARRSSCRTARRRRSASPTRPTYTLERQGGAKADVQARPRVAAQGSVGADGNFTATKVQSPGRGRRPGDGQDGNTITIKTEAGGTVTINVDGSTTYPSRGKQPRASPTSPSANVVEAEGTLERRRLAERDGVRILPNGQAPRPGQFRGPGARASRQPSPAAPTTARLEPPGGGRPPPRPPRSRPARRRRPAPAIP